MKFLGSWLVTTIATVVAIALVPGINAVGGSYLGPLMCALTLAFVNATVRPILSFLSLPVTVLTLGIFLLVINALMLELAGSISVGLFGSGISIDSFGSAFLGSIIISLASSFIGRVFATE